MKVMEMFVWDFACNYFNRWDYLDLANYLMQYLEELNQLSNRLCFLL